MSLQANRHRQTYSSTWIRDILNKRERSMSPWLRMRRAQCLLFKEGFPGPQQCPIAPSHEPIPRLRRALRQRIELVTNEAVRLGGVGVFRTGVPVAKEIGVWPADLCRCTNPSLYLSYSTEEILLSYTLIWTSVLCLSSASRLPTPDQGGQQGVFCHHLDATHLDQAFSVAPSNDIHPRPLRARMSTCQYLLPCPFTTCCAD